MDVTLGLTGTYLLAVAGTNVANTSVSYSFDPILNVNPTNALTLGTAVSGTLANPYDEATYTFTGSSGQNLFFDGLSGDPSIYAYLYNPSGSYLFSVGAGSDYGPFTLSEPGTYSLDLYGGGSTGNYDVRLLDTSVQPLVTTSSPTTVNGTITPGTGTNVYQIMGTAGEQLAAANPLVLLDIGQLVRLRPE